MEHAEMMYSLAIEIYFVKTNKKSTGFNGKRRMSL